MMISVGILLATVILLQVLKKRKIRMPPKVIRFCILAEVLGTVLSGAEWVMNRYAFTPEISRPAAGEGDSEETLTVLHGEARDEVTVHVSERKLRETEAESLFQEAMAEIDSTFFENGDSGDAVRSRLHPKHSYQDGQVEAMWSYSVDDVIDSEGSVAWKEVKEPLMVYATVDLMLDDFSTTYSFPLRLMPKSPEDEDGFAYYLKESLTEADEADPEGETLFLPETLSDIPLTWQGADSHTGAEVSALALLGAAAMIFGEEGEKRRQKKKREQDLERNYPDLVSALSLYVGAGIPVKTAFQRIAESYGRSRVTEETGKKKSKENPGYDCVVRTVRRMSDGVGEITAYREFGEMAEHRHYRKLSLLLTQNVKKGTAGLIALLENEEREAFEMRKATARVRGEEASTKLLIPMLGLMVMMLVIMIVPALMGIEL